MITHSETHVGGKDLAIFCLALDTPGTPIQNPRQTPSWHVAAL
jgi:hypothetical protein